ncbi:MAG: radical SAM protein [Myxococcales bacterium]|nr:radical SAM protein [Myxococcales bacterium]
MKPSDPATPPKPKRRLGLAPAAAPPPPRSALDLARDAARGRGEMTETAALERFGVVRPARALKTTVSLCPDCLTYAPALVYVKGGRALIRKECSVHGMRDAVLENDARYYFLSNKDRSGVVFAHDRVFDIPAFLGVGEGCCEGGACDGTDQTANKSCTVLVEVTDACNLACPVCYSDAKGDKKLPLAAFKAYLEALIVKKGGLDSVQLTGGEGLLHPEIWELLAFACEHPKIKKVYLPTNGLLVNRPGVPERLARYKAKLMVLLQFDGTSDRTDAALRDASPARARREVVDKLGELGVFMQLTMTLARRVNDDEVGELIDFAMRHDHVKVVALQPATYSGRYELAPDPTERLTLSDVVKAVVRQTQRARVQERDFVPIPCSHPNCGWITLFLRRAGLVHNVVKYVDLPKVIDSVAYKTLLSTDELRGAVDEGGGVRGAVTKLAKGLVRSQDMFTVAIKPFMDRHSYDQDRVDNCCHHLLDTKGEARSFCEYNALLRQSDPWDAFPSLASPVE